MVAGCKKYDADIIFQAVNEVAGDFNVWYVGAYESDNDARVVTLYLQPSDKPVILLLSSYSQVHWNVSVDDQTDLALIVYSSFQNGTTVSTGRSTDPVIQAERGVLPYEYTLETSCRDYGSTYHCQYIDGLKEIDNASVKITGQKVDGFSGEYDVELLWK